MPITHAHAGFRNFHCLLVVHSISPSSFNEWSAISKLKKTVTYIDPKVTHIDPTHLLLPLPTSHGPYLA